MWDIKKTYTFTSDEPLGAIPWDLDFGEWKPKSRWMTFSPEVGNSVYGSWDFYQSFISFGIDDGIHVREELEKTIRICSIASYPSSYSDDYFHILALGSSQASGDHEKSLLSKIYWNFFHNYEKYNKMTLGRMKCKSNPMAILFPEFWAFQLENCSEKVKV